MKFELRAIRRSLLSAVFIAQLSVPAVAGGAAAGHSGAVSCVMSDPWSARKAGRAIVDSRRGTNGLLYGRDSSHSGLVPAVHETVAAPSWVATFKGTGADRLRGAARSRVLAFGVLWSVNPADLGVTKAAAISALLRSGAKIARADDDGSVYFRALERNKDAVAARAQQILVPSRSAISGRPTAVSWNGAVADSRSQAPRAMGLDVTVAMLRLEGRVSDDPIAFLETMPGGMSVLPFGTSFVVHVPASRVAEVWDAVDDEGRRVLLVGATSSVTAGSQIGVSIGKCGGAALLRRFPTPNVRHMNNLGAVLEVEGQAISVRAGDMVLVLQAPTWGNGLEVAVARFAST